MSSPAAPLPLADPAHADLLRARRARAAEALGLTDEIVLVGAGEPVPLPEETDQVYPFRAHAEYFYLTGLDCPGGVVAYDPHRGPQRGWTSFVPGVTEAERVWEDRAQPPGEPLAKLAPWLGTRRDRPIVALGAALRGVPADPARQAAARERLTHARRPKDAAELTLVRRAAAATAAGFAAARAHLRPGVTERALQVEIEAAFARAGASRPGYGTIVGAGPHAAVLHFAPSGRAAAKGELVLVDAGAEVDRYVADVTRTLVVGGKPDAFRRDLLQLVQAVEETAVAGCRPGVEWKEIHLRAAVELAAGLVEMELLRGRPETLVERGTHTLFFPHGIGHLVGLGVRDASGRLPGRLRDPSPSLQTLRLDLPLESGYLTTVEPGIYFIRALLQDPARRRHHAAEVNWALAEQHLDVGGVRIEDTVLVTPEGPEILTADIPKTW